MKVNIKDRVIQSVLLTVCVFITAWLVVNTAWCLSGLFRSADYITSDLNLNIMHYSRDYLLAQRKSSVTNLSPDLSTKLSQLDIARSHPWTRNTRGCRGGRNKQRIIKVRITDRNTVNSSNCQSPVNEQNLVILSQRPICSLVTSRNSPFFYNQHQDKQCGVNSNNLLTVSAVKQKLTSFCLMNAQSVRNKTETIVDYILEKDLDICAFTETWLSEQDNIKIGDLTPSGYCFSHVPRSDRPGGGVGLLYKAGLDIRTQEISKRRSFEYQHVLLVSGSTSIRIVIIYRPPGSHQPLSVFIDDFSELVSECSTLTGNLFICGDFNYHVDDSSDREATSVLQLFDMLNLKQHVSDPTHIHGHTLDLILTRCSENTVADVPVSDFLVSDHLSVICTLQTIKPAFQKKEITYRKVKNINIENFCEDIHSSALFSDPSDDPETCYDQYCTVLRDLMNNHAPERKKVVVIRPMVSWYNEDITSEKQKRRQLERKWRITKSTVYRKSYEQQRNNTQQEMQNAKRSDLNKQVTDCAGDQKQLFRIANNITYQKQDNPLPPYDSIVELVNGFNDFFTEKIELIRSSLDAQDLDSSDHDLQQSSPSTAPPRLRSFTPASKKEVLKLISKSATKSCPLDPIPTGLLKECQHELAPSITHIVNTSLATGNMPGNLKVAMVSPLLKKPSLDKVFKSYRPVSNLPYVSKIVEKVVATRLTEHIKLHKLDDPHQSAYKQHHGTETALLRVKNDLLMAMDGQKVALLLLLDLSAAFDTIDHDVLLHRLETYIGISGRALEWMSSYLKDREQYVSLQGCNSESSKLKYGVPQGSVLGPILFTVYLIPLRNIILKHGIDYEIYADDNQLYITFKPVDSTKAVEKMEQCIDEIRKWMITNKLKFNDDKTEALLIGSPQQLKKVDLQSMSVGNVQVHPSTSARNLGVIFDSNLSMKSHIQSVCKSAWYHLRNLFQIRKYLTQPAAETLVHAFISSRLDNGNSLFIGLPECTLKHLQLIQNTAARVITRRRKYDHITPVLKSLHWLPIRYRVQFKVLVITFKVIHGNAPEYLRELIQPKKNGRQLRSSNENLLHIPRTKNVTHGDSCFQVAAPRLWNNLPCALRRVNSLDTFKNSLKTHLFKCAYDLN